MEHSTPGKTPPHKHGVVRNSNPGHAGEEPITNAPTLRPYPTVFSGFWPSSME